MLLRNWSWHMLLRLLVCETSKVSRPVMGFRSRCYLWLVVHRRMRLMMIQGGSVGC